MSKLSRFILLILLVSIGLNCGCGGGTATNSIPVTVFSDLHFNPYDNPALFPALVASDISGWPAIFKGSGATSGWGLDTNYPLLMLSLASVKQNSAASPVIIFTGDLLGHYFPQQYYQYCNCQDQAAMEAFANKTVAFVMEQVRASGGNVPVVFAVGNGDSYTGYGPDSTFLAATAELYYTKFLNGTADHQAFLDSFKTGGYYSAEPLGKNLMVIGLNTIVFSPLLKTDNTVEVAAELAWFDARLATAKAEGKKVWLLMHAPPGADIGTTAGTIDANGHIASATMMWKPEYQAGFLDILAKYPGQVSLILAGHTHMDEYRVLTQGNVVVVTPSIAPAFGNNPAFRILTVERDTFAATDSRALNYDLGTLPAQFSSYYVFSDTYPMHGNLRASLTQLAPALVTNPAQQALYRGHFYSGHNSVAPDPNPITNANWPVYGCGIAKMAQADLVGCVNSY